MSWKTQFVRFFKETKCIVLLLISHPPRINLWIGSYADLYSTQHANIITNSQLRRENTSIYICSHIHTHIHSRERREKMERLRSVIGWWAVLTCAVMLMMPPEVSAVRYIVGANMGWTSNVNYTIWAQDKHFYLGDWLCTLFSFSLSN